MKHFTPGELEVMQVLWAHGRLKPAQIEELFPRPIKNAALRSLLLILLGKGHVVRRRVGKAYYYEARTPREGSLRSMTRRLAEVFCGGSTASLIAHLLETEKLSEADIAELQRIAAQKLERPRARKQPARKDPQP